VQLNADLAITKLCKPDSGPYYAGQGNAPLLHHRGHQPWAETATGVKILEGHHRQRP